MNNNINKYIYYDRAKEIAWKEFLKIHEKENLPEWFEKCLIYDGEMIDENKWVIFITIAKKRKLAPNEHFEVIRERERIVSIDPKTGERRVLISYEPEEFELIYKVEVDLKNDIVNIIKDTDICQLDGSLYQPYR